MRRTTRSTTIVHRATHQTGKTSVYRDRKVPAKRPGLRRTGWGTKYYEARKNRSDVNRRTRL